MATIFLSVLFNAVIVGYWMGRIRQEVKMQPQTIDLKLNSISDRLARIEGMFTLAPTWNTPPVGGEKNERG